MKNNRTEENKNIFDNEFSLYQTFLNFSHLDNQKEHLFNSTKLRHLINYCDTPCISLKTFDTGIRLLNKKFSTNINKNPVFLKPSELVSDNLPLHTIVFYKKLPSCLCINMNSPELYNKCLEDAEHKAKRERLNLCLGVQAYNNSPSYTYTFDIHNFDMPPFFTPLFIGIIGSLKKEKSSWHSLRENALIISESFYNENHAEINQFLPQNADIRKDVYTYWLKLHFPDELFNLLSKFDDIINNGNDRILSYNLNIIANVLSKDIFFSSSKQNDFLQHITQTLKLYLDTPLIDPITLERNRLDLCTECKSSLHKFHTEEMALIRKLYSKQETSP